MTVFWFLAVAADWQTPMAVLVVLGALAFLLRPLWLRVRRAGKGKEEAGCGSGCGCPAPKSGLPTALTKS